MPQPTLVTKSIRLNLTENKILKRASQREGISEAALMKKFVLDGLARRQLEQAITAYTHGETDLSAAARYAGISVHQMMTELEQRNITPPAAREKFLDGLQTLADTFGGSDELRQTLTELSEGEQNIRDVEILNQNADRLNEEAADVLSYQAAV